MRLRQIHLDFHTSPVIGDVAQDFNKEEFVETLKKAKVNSINIFAKCHHGMCYYPTKVGKMHPSLKFDLLGEMIDVLHKNDIKAPIYFPIGWEEVAAENANWLEIGPDGVLGGKVPFEKKYNTWKKLCHNKQGYKDYIKAQIKELMESYDVDGFWFDIIFQYGCVCPDCIKAMKENGLDPENPDDVRKNDHISLLNFQKEINEYIMSFGKDVSIFYNAPWRPDGGYTEKYSIEERTKHNTHIEIESLPSEEWGYNHFPLFANFHNRNNEMIVGMNGKFHLVWGDHGSLRNREALEFECFRIIANGGACSIGDQLHPRAVLDKTVYNNIGYIFNKVEEREPWCVDSKKVAEIGVVVCNKNLGRDFTSDEGVLRMLMELHYTFDFITVSDSLDMYKAVILPDEVTIDSKFKDKLLEYANNGGKIIATYHSLPDDNSFGIEYEGEYEYHPAYTVIKEGFCPIIEEMPYIMYEQGAKVKTDGDILAYIGDPYFNRTYDCFSSHRQFPFNKVSESGSVIMSGNICYCAFPLFKDYRKTANRFYRNLFNAMLYKSGIRPKVKSNLPTCAEITVREQENRNVVHILSYIAERRGMSADVVDTKIPLYNIEIAMDLSKEPKKVYLAPSMEELDFTYEDGVVKTNIPCINGYEILVSEY